MGYFIDSRHSDLIPLPTPQSSICSAQRAPPRAGQRSCLARALAGARPPQLASQNVARARQWQCGARRLGNERARARSIAKLTSRSLRLVARAGRRRACDAAPPAPRNVLRELLPTLHERALAHSCPERRQLLRIAVALQSGFSRWLPKLQIRPCLRPELDPRHAHLRRGAGLRARAFIS